ncbi:MAG: GNAT family protein [Planctomycetota bacterium]|nr:GNAT family protein [Planctomycetota bacterium]
MACADGLPAVGERVALRLPVEADRAAFGELVVASRAWLDRFAPGSAAADDPSGHVWLDAALAANEGGRAQKCLIVGADDDQPRGMLNFNEIVRGLFQSAYLGYWIGAAYARQGLMGEALALALRYAFGPLGLHRVEANIQPENEASIALVRRAGFVREGFSKRYLKIGGVWCDHERWALTAEDYEAGA